MIKGVGIFTSGKGGVGKTPYALLYAILLRRRNNNVLVLDYNFLNPDLYEIYRRISGEEPEAVYEVDGQRLPHPVSLVRVFLPGGGKVFVATRMWKFRYLPYPPFVIFQTANMLRDYLNEDFYVVVDTNLNIPAFNVVLPEMTEAVTKSLEYFERITFYHIWSISVLRRRGGKDEKSELELIRSTVTNFSHRGLNLFGKDGERIVHIISPRIFGKPSVKSFRERVSSVLKGITKKKEEVLAVEIEEKEFLNKYIEKIWTAYSRSSRTIKLADLLEIERDFNEMIKVLLAKNPRYVLEADPFDIETLFLSFMIEKLFDKATMTMPLNAIIIPFMIKKLINFVDLILISEVVEEESILERESPATEIVDAWISSVLAQGKI